MDPLSLRTLQDLALCTAEQGSTPVSVLQPLRDSDRDPLVPVSRFDPQTAPKMGSRKLKDQNRSLSSAPAPVFRCFALFQAAGKEIGFLSTPERSLINRCS